MSTLEDRVERELEEFIRDGVYKRLKFLDGPQGARVRMEEHGDVIILSSNNYLGLSNEPAVVEAGTRALDRFGAGTASVRFICGTFSVHRDLEAACARLVGTPASLSFVSCWNANEALPGTLLGEQDIVISDQLNHASIIDGIRLGKAITKCQTAVYRHADMADLDAKLAGARDRRIRMVITDGIFSMEGSIAPLPDLLEVCRKHEAVLVVDDSHATGVLGANGRGTAEHFGCRRGDRYHHVDARKGARRRGRWLRGRVGRGVRLPHATRPSATLLQCPATDRRGERAREHRIPRGASGTGDPAPRQRHLFPPAAARARLQAASRRDPDHSGHPWRDLRRDSDERPAPGRRSLRHRIRLPRGASGPGPRSVPDLRRAHARTISIKALAAFKKVGKKLKLI